MGTWVATVKTLEKRSRHGRVHTLLCVLSMFPRLKNVTTDIIVFRPFCVHKYMTRDPFMYITL